MKKFISFITSAVLVCGSMVSPIGVSAAYEDYMPGQKAANLIPDASAGSGWIYLNARNNGSIGNSKGTADDISAVNILYSYTGSNALVLGSAWRGFEGFELNSQSGKFDFAPEGGKTYVIKAKLKNVSDDGITPSFGVAMNDSYGGRRPVTTNEYGAEGMAIERDWTEFNATVTLPDDYVYTNCMGSVIFAGFPAGTQNGAAFLIDASSKDSVYLAEEQAYDITNEIAEGSAEVKAGDRIILSASVINQLGITGGLSQNFEWTVLDENKIPVDSDFEINQVNNKADIRISENAQEGKYYIYVSSADYEGMGKAVQINISPADDAVYDDYMPEIMPQNIYPINIHYTDRNNADVKAAVDITTADGVSAVEWETNKEVANVWAGHKFVGAVLNKSYKITPFKANTNYVFSAKVRNSALSVDESPYWGIAMGQENGSAVAGYPYDKGMAVTSESWMDYKVTVKQPDNFDPSLGNNKGDGWIFMGFSAAKANAKVQLDRSSVYMAEETVYDITNKIENEPENIRVGDSITLAAEVINQIGITGTCKQNFKWFILDSDRKIINNGFEINADNNKATVTINEDTEPGIYYVVAESTDYKGMRKSAEIDVKKGVIKDKEVTDSDISAAKKAVIESNGDDVVEMTDKYTLKATVLNQEEKPGDLEQDFNWYVLESDCATIAESVSLEKLDGQNARVKIDLYAEPGEYYAVAEPVIYEGIRKLHKFTINKPTAKECAVELLNTETAEELSENLAEYLNVLEINGEYIENADKLNLSELIENRVKTEKLTSENAGEIITRLAVISLYNKNSGNISLYDEQGNFNYRDILGIDTACQESTLMKVFDEILSAEGRKSIQTVLTSGNYKSEQEFYGAFFENVILKAITYPSVMGTQYIEDILTKENAAKADINIDKYTALKNKSNANKTLARNVYTKSTLESTIKGFRESGSDSSSSSGSSGGGSSSSVIKTPQTVPDTSKTSFDSFSDVNENYWAYDEIYHLKKLGIISGVDEERFDPESSVTREQFIKMFLEAFKYDMVPGKLSYNDTVDDAWYSIYLSTALKNGLINGISESEFGIGIPITRQDICVIIMRAMKGEPEEGEEASFTDFEDISEYAKDAVTYLSNYGVINGFDDGKFMPKNNCTRAQAAKIICTLINIGGVAK
ncbi:MAG: S-layer homology domain-containing protein [Clostridia bacterium]|nr:S-layer homology domain-containing protein [Clostridia bacterium]